MQPIELGFEPMLDMTRALMLRLGPGAVCLGAFWVAQAESIPPDSPRWQLEPQKGMQVVYARTTIVSDRDQLKKLNVGYSDDVSVFLNDRIRYRGRSAQRFRDPGFLG